MGPTETLNREALYTDETAQFRFPLEAEAGDVITFRFRTLKDNAAGVMLCTRAMQRSMEKAFTKGLFDYYETRMVIGNEPFEYCFAVTDGENYVYYDRLGVSQESMINRNRRMFRVIPGFAVPGWAKGAVMYQIFVDRFRNGSTDNDVRTGEYSYMHHPVEQVDDWYSLPRDPDVGRFYGGDLVGVMEKLDYLKHLGVEAIYFNPLFVSPSNHKYDIQDYDHIDPHFTGFVEDDGALLPEGSDDNRLAERYLRRVTDEKNLEYANAYFARLIREIHKRGMKVIMDGVFNHCGASNRWMDRDGIYSGKDGFPDGAYIDPDSPYRGYFIFDNITGSRAANHRYTGWWGFDTLPKLYYENSRELQKEILRIARKWVSEPYNADGWRLDVAADLGLSDRFNHHFWREFRAAVKEENPDAVIIAEHYGEPHEWLEGGEWDTVMNYDAFMEPVSFFLTGMEKHSDEYNPWLEGDGHYFFRILLQRMSQLPVQSLYTAMNELSNHDHSRFLTRTNHRVGRLKTVGSAAAGEGISYGIFRQGVVIQFTLPGAPTIYYGDETCVVGWTDPDSRRSFPWGHEDWSMISFHREMIRIHKKYSALRNGAFKPLAADFGYIAYGRFDENSAVLVTVNHWGTERTVEIPVWLIGTPENCCMLRVMQTTDFGYNVGVKKYPLENGILKITLPPQSSMVFAAEKMTDIRSMTYDPKEEEFPEDF